jgi:hypothetical protein
MATTLHDLIDAIETKLAYLQANHASMPIKMLQAERGQAIAFGTHILNDADLDISREDYMRVYDAVIELDRVGY